MTSQASLSLSLLLTKVTHAQYRKRFRASYNIARWQARKGNKGLSQKAAYVSERTYMFQMDPICLKLRPYLVFSEWFSSPYVEKSRMLQTMPQYVAHMQVSALFFVAWTWRRLTECYRRAKATQGNTNFQKRILLANNFWITTRGPKSDKVSTSEQQLISRPLQLLLNTICKLLFSQLLERLWKTLQPHLQRTDKNYRNSNTWKTTLWRKMTRLKKSYLYFLWKLR